MAKLALLALLIGAGCVADDPSDSSRVLEAEAAAINVIDQAELPTMTPDNVDPVLVVVTGIEIPGRTPTQPHIDLGNVDTREHDPQARELCRQVEALPDTDVCSLLCQPQGFAARIFDNGDTAGCAEQTCVMPNGTAVQVDVCN